MSHQIFDVSVFSFMPASFHPPRPLKLKFMCELLSCIGTWVEIDDIFIFSFKRVAVMAHCGVNLTQVYLMQDNI